MTLPRRLLNWTRTLHIYLTMAATVLLMFVAVTGFMLNHKEQFGLAESTLAEHALEVPYALVEQADKLAIAELVRARFGEIGIIADKKDISIDESEIRLTFRKPGQVTTLTIQRPAVESPDMVVAQPQSVEALVEIESRGVKGILADLHKVKPENSAWKWVMDAAAIVLFLAAFSGIALLLALPRRRVLGLAALMLGTGACLLVYLVLF